jgi:rhomboid protease GluP
VGVVDAGEEALMKRAPVTRAILILIAAVFALEVFDHNAWKDPNELARLGGLLSWSMMDGEYWRLITATFLHGGWLHWAANSWALFQLGTLYEVLFGSKRFALVYFASGICASIASAFHIESVGVGASGAVFGILGAFIFSIWRSPQYRHQPWTRSLLGQIVFWTILNLYIGFQFPFIDNVAHIGGLVAGLLLGLIPHRIAPPPPGSSVIDVHPYDDGAV